MYSSRSGTPTCHRVFGSRERRQSASQAQAVLRVGQDPFPPGPRTQPSDTWEVPVCVAPCRHQREVGKGWSALHSLPPTLGVLGFSSGVNCILIPKRERERESKDERKEKERRKGGWVEGGKEGNSIRMEKNGVEQNSSYPSGGCYGYICIQCYKNLTF